MKMFGGYVAKKNRYLVFGQLQSYRSQAGGDISLVTFDQVAQDPDVWLDFLELRKMKTSSVIAAASGRGGGLI